MYSSFFITTSDTPLSAVRIILLLSFLSSSMAFCSSNEILDLGGFNFVFLRMALTSPLNSSTSPLEKMNPPKSNISLEEQKAIDELRKDNNRIILTADKGVSLVVMKKEEYIKKAEELLLTDTYKTISIDPTNKHKTKFIKLLKTIKAEGESMKQFTKGSTQQGQGFPNFMGSLKCTRKAYPETNSQQYWSSQL